MASEMFNEFYAFFYFLPEFYMTVNATRYNEICFRDHDMSDYVAMHVALFITFGFGEIFEVEFLMFQNCMENNNQIFMSTQM